MKLGNTLRTFGLILMAAALGGCNQKQADDRKAPATNRPASAEELSTPPAISASIPLQTIGSLKPADLDHGTDQVVRIQGTVLDKRSGEFVVVNDGTGTVLAETRQTILPPVRQSVEVFGQLHLAMNGDVIGLKNCVITKPGGGSAAAAAPLQSPRPTNLPVLTKVSEIRDLSAEEAAWHYPVRLRAVVTVNTKANRYFFAQDESAGISVRAPEIPADLNPGALVDIQGVSDPGGFSPIVLASNVTILGATALPPAQAETSFELGAGQDGSQWIEVRGVIRSLTFSNRMARLKLSDSSGLVTVNVPAKQKPDYLLDAIVRIQGACGSLANDHRQFMGSEMWASSLDFVTVEKPGTAQPLDRPAEPIASLNQFHPRQSLQQCVTVAGVVTYVDPDFFFIEDTEEGTRVEAAPNGLLQPGDYVMAAGYPGLGNYGYLLNNAQFKRVSHRQMPEGVLLPAENPLDPRLHDRWVRIQGRFTRYTKIGTADTLTLQTGNRIYDIRTQSPVSERIKNLSPGATLEVSGIYRVLSDEIRTPKSFQLAVPGEANIRILAEPSWWTISHTATLVGGMGVIIGATILWGLVLQRKVQERTASLQQSEYKFRTLVEQSLVGVYIIQNDRFVYVNPRMAELLGYTPDEMVAAGRIDDIIFWEDQAMVREQIRRRIGGEINSAHYSFRGRRKGGEIIHLEVLGTRTEYAGNPAVIGTLLDVTERKLSQDKIGEQARMLDLASDAIMVCDLNDRITYWNQNAHRIFGWTAHEAIGADACEKLGISREEFHRAKTAVIQDHQWHGEFEHRHHDNGGKTVAARWTLVHSAHGTPASILTISTDITQQKKLEGQLLRTQRLNSIGVLAGGIAHDLNNVLAPIMMSSRLLELDPSLSADHRKLINTILTSTQRAAGLVKQIVTFARGTGEQKHTVQPLQLLEELGKLLRETLPKSISLRIQSESSLRAIHADPTQIHQVLMNLCINARDAMPDGGELVVAATNHQLDKPHVALGGEFAPGPYILFSVTDNGIGMTPEVRDRIFDPFFSTKSIGQGTGLGLSTALGIVKSHGGFIQVQSQPRKGSCFKVYLPAQTEKKTDTEIRGKSHPALHGNQELILVVDDEPLLREIAEQTLVLFGYRVVTAENGKVAVECYQQRQEEIALVLTDIMMPVMDGAAAIQAIAQINPQAKVIAASGRTTESDVANPVIRAFLSKPYTSDLLLKTVHEVLRHGKASFPAASQD